MLKSLIVLSALVSVFGQNYDFTDNLVDFEYTPYQRISLPHLNHNAREEKIMNLRRKSIKNAILMKNRFKDIKSPSHLIQSGEVMTSLSNIKTSLKDMLNEVGTNLLGGLNTGLKLVIANVPALFFGAFLVFGFCKVTAFCSKLFSFHSLKETLKEYSTLITAEKLNVASEFVQDAIRRYGALQIE